MRKVESEVVGAFLKGAARTMGNTSTDGTALFLHGNRIAERREDGSIWGTLAGWPTVTTRSRLNAIVEFLPTHCRGQGVYQDKGEQRLDDGTPLDPHNWYRIDQPWELRLQASYKAARRNNPGSANYQKGLAGRALAAARERGEDHA